MGRPIRAIRITRRCSKDSMEMILRFFSEPAVFPVFILLFVGITFLVFHFTQKRIIRCYSIVCMCVWGISLLYVTWLSSTPVMETRINLIPFQLDGNAMLFDYITNIVMFIPFPILLYGILQKRLSFMTLSVAGIGLSLAIELLQLLTHRGICDIEDFILNSAGVIIGSLLTLLLMKAEKKN